MPAVTTRSMAGRTRPPGIRTLATTTEDADRTTPVPETTNAPNAPRRRSRALAIVSTARWSGSGRRTGARVLTLGRLRNATGGRRLGGPAARHPACPAAPPRETDGLDHHFWRHSGGESSMDVQWSPPDTEEPRRGARLGFRAAGQNRTATSALSADPNRISVNSHEPKWCSAGASESKRTPTDGTACAMDVRSSRKTC